MCAVLQRNRVALILYRAFVGFQRLLLFVGALVGLSLLVFALLRILPGDVPRR